MEHKSPWKPALLITLAATALSACLTDQEATPGQAPTAPTAPPSTPPAEPVEPVAEMPPTRLLEFAVEGDAEKAPATLVESDLGYAFYLIEGFVFTPEEPGKDMVFHEGFPGFFLRIEPFPLDTSVEAVRSSSEQALKALSNNVADIRDVFFDESIRSQAVFILHAGNTEASVNMIGMPIGDKLFRFTLHFPVKEAGEGITPRFYPMIRSFTTPAP